MNESNGSEKSRLYDLIRVSSSLRVRTRLLFKPMKTAFAEHVSVSFSLSLSFIAYSVWKLRTNQIDEYLK